MPSQRFSDAFAKLDPERQHWVQQWMADNSLSHAPMQVRDNVLADDHLDEGPFTALLEVIADAYASGGDWVAAFESTAGQHYLRGDPIRCTYASDEDRDLLDHAVRQDHLADALGLSTRRAGTAWRYLARHAARPDPRVETLSLGGPQAPLVWATFQGVANLSNTDIRANQSRRMGLWWKGLSAFQVRTLLGLSHVRKATHLVMLTYQRPNVPLLYSTVADGGSAVDFRPAGLNDPCGVTLNLATGGRGMPEAVHQNVQAGRLLKAAAPLGAV